MTNVKTGGTCERVRHRLKGFISWLLSSLIRKKRFTDENVSESGLKRCLSTMDLTFLGVGSTLGLGIYILAGSIASTSSGPSIIISFLIAAVASVFSGLCYAEFGARVPRAGSAYVYSYVSVGELMAFVIGWNLILEYVIGTASVARGYSNYIDYLAGNKMQNFFEKHLPIHVQYMSSFPDFLSLVITVAISGMLAIGVNESAKLNNTFTILNLLIVIYSVICGAFKANISNWRIPKNQVPPNRGNGGFMPYGFSQMMTGAASAFYGFVGFDCIATTGEEVKNPQRAIPISIIGSLFIVFLSYFGVSAIQTLMWPYYDQDQKAPLPYVFEKVGWPVAKWIISVGALFALSTSLLGAMFPLPRVLYAMANDGVIFRFLAKIHPKYKTPIISTFIAGVFSGVVAMFFDVDQLIQMMSIGTLLAYSLVAISVLILRFKKDVDESYHDGDVQMSCDLRECNLHHSRQDYLRQIFNLDNVEVPTQLSARVSICLITVIGLLMASVCAILVFLENNLLHLEILIPLCFDLLLVIVGIVALSRQPQNPKKISFKVPVTPLTPMLSIFVNIYLMMKLTVATWIRFGVWMAVGFVIYFGYGITHSSEAKRERRMTSSPPTKATPQKETSPIVY